MDIVSAYLFDNFFHCSHLDIYSCIQSPHQHTFHHSHKGMSHTHCRYLYTINSLQARNTQRAQTSLAKADHYFCIADYIMCMKGCEAAKQEQCYYILHCLGGERLTPKVLDHYLHHDLVMLQLLLFAR